MRARSLRFLATATACGGLALTAPLLGAGCQQTATTVPVRALERSGHVSFVCLGPRGPAGTFEQPIESCSAQQFSDINAYDYEDDAGVVYIYLGTSGGLLATPAQVVRAAALPNQRRPVGAFGFSLSGGLDLDGNQHAGTRTLNYVVTILCIIAINNFKMSFADQN